MLLCGRCVGQLKERQKNRPKDTIRMNDFVAKLVLSWCVLVLCSYVIVCILIVLVCVHLDVICRS